MPYYPTLAEDVARAKEILDRGRADRDLQQIEGMDPALRAVMLRHSGGTIFGVDVYAAYKLLESFVAAIEAVGPKVCELAVRHEQLRPVTGRERFFLPTGAAEGAGVPECTCRTRGCGHAARLHVGGICQACACGGWS